MRKTTKSAGEKIVKDIKRATRKHYSSEEKIRIVLDGLRGEAGLQDRSPKPKHVWNRVPAEVKRKVVDLALKETELSPRELAVTFTDQERYFVSESKVYRVLKAHDLITSPAFIVLKAADEFQHKMSH